jgi:ATP-binding cassette subfamily F protein 3
MLSVNQLSKSFGIQPIFKQISLSVNPGDRAALIGENGCGKTTLLRIIAGEEQPDSGVVQFTPADLRFGYLPQGLRLPEDLTLGEHLSRLMGDLDALAAEIAALAERLSDQPADPRLVERYDRALARLQLTQEHENGNRELIRSLGLDGIPPEQPVYTLSGGQKTRLSLAGVLLNQPSLLLLDEPTNHLDIAMLRWLEDWLSDFPGGVLVVSHDRAFIDRIATSLVEMADGSLKVYPGNYSDYLEARLVEEEKHWQAYQDQQDEIAQLRKAAAHVRSTARFHKGGKADPSKTDGFSVGHFANRSLHTVRRAKHLEQRLEKLLTDDRIDKPSSSWQMRLVFDQVPPSGQDVLALDRLSIGYDGEALLEGISLNLQAGQRVALIGENGSGKSTLLRTIAGQIPPVDGFLRLGANVRLGYLAQEQDTLDPDSTPIDAIRSLKALNQTTARTFLHQFLFSGEQVFSPIKTLSYGERARLMLASLVIRECNLLLLDEPLNHLDIPSRARFESALTGFEGTILAVVHDRYFLERFAQIIWEIEDGKIALCYQQVML